MRVNWTRWRFIVRWVVTALVLGGSAAAGFGDVEVTEENVVASIKKGVDYLFSQEKAGKWEVEEKPVYGDMTGGRTAIVVYTLLHVGKGMQDPRLDAESVEMEPAIKYLTELVPKSNYTAAYQALALVQLPKNRDRMVALERAKQYMLATVQRGGGHGYAVKPPMLPEPNWWDNSNTQIANLALWELQDYGIEVSNEYWEVMDQHWRKHQDISGGWAYRNIGANADWKQVKQSMSAAGVASLYITWENTDTEVQLKSRTDKNIDNGLAWLAKNFAPDPNNLYSMYSCERVGLASGRKFFGTVDWYRQSAAQIMASQAGDGAFPASDPTTKQAYTALGILFLARGHNPVFVNKLEYNGPWDARPRDAANLSRRLEKLLERPLNWQIVNLNVPVDGWREAPILLITGSKDPQFTADDIKKLRSFALGGGLIFSTADGNTKAFSDAMKKYAIAVGDDKYEPKDLPPDDYLYTLEFKAQRPLGLWGLSNGVRQLWVHSPMDMGAIWQRHANSATDAWAVAENLYVYASGKLPLRSRLESPVIAAKTGTTAGRSIAMARLNYPGNADPEPGAWPRLAQIAARDWSVDLKIINEDVKDLDGTKTPIAHLTGTTRFDLPAADVAKLRAFLDGGGTLFADAAGGSLPFTDSFQALVQQIYKDGGLERIAANDVLYSGKAANSVAVKSVTYQKFLAVKGSLGDKPRLLGFKKNNRWVIIFSQEDVTTGILDSHTWGIAGYSSESAQALARDVLMTAGTKP